MLNGQVDGSQSSAFRSNRNLRNGSLPGMSRSLLQQNGSNIMKGGPRRQIQIQTQFLRKGMGRGGSPTEYDQGLVD